MKNRLLLIALSVTPLLTLTSAVRGDFAVTLTDPGLLSTVSIASTRGWEFQVQTPITVTRFGFWDDGSNGLLTAHEVGIFSSSSVLLGSAIVPAGTVASIEGATLPEGGFRYVGLGTPLDLNPGTYRIGAFYPVGSDFQRFFTSLTAAPEITYVTGRAVNAPTVTDPNVLGPFPNSIFGPNFQFQPAGAIVPEPSGLTLLGLGALGLLAHGRKWREQAGPKGVAA